jgi:hypothetical protein
MTLSTNGVPCDPHQRQTVFSNADPMIHSTSPSDRTARTDAVAPATAKPTVRRADSDQFSAGQSAALREALAAQPEIRPDVVARAKALAADPAYPPREVLAKVAGFILASPDFTADES